MPNAGFKRTFFHSTAVTTGITKKGEISSVRAIPRPRNGRLSSSAKIIPTTKVITTTLTDSTSVGFDEVDEILFAVRGVPVPHGRSDARVEGAGVFVRLLDGAVWPVIPATHARQEAYSIASGLAARIGVGVKQVGAGWSSRDRD